MAGDHEHVLPSPSLIVLAGPPASGKSSWATEHFPHATVSSDHLRSLAGEGPHDMRASATALQVLDDLVTARLRRRLTTVVDTLGTDAAARRTWRHIAQAAGLPTYVVTFDTAAADCRRFNRERIDRVPDAVLRSALQRWPDDRAELLAESWDGAISHAAHAPANIRTAAPDIALASSADRQPPGGRVSGVRIGLQIGRFDWATGENNTTALIETAAAAEQAGFDSLWVMDHFRQIPQVGQAWEPMLEAWTALGFLAAHTKTVRIGSMVSCVSHRNIGLLAKSAATVDVLSGGRLVCGIGAGWFDQEQRSYGYPPLDTSARLDLLEDAAEALPLLWGKGAKAYEGRRTIIPEAMAYPRPVQDPLPLLVGGGGERRTLAIAAAHAQACNVMGDAATVARKLAVLDGHLDDLGRDRAAVERTALQPGVTAPNQQALERLVADLAPPRTSVERYAAAVGAGTPTDQVARFASMADAGVQTVLLTLPRVDAESVAAWGPVIERLR